MILNYITWNVNPEILPIGPLSLRWYGLLFALAFVAGYWIFQKFCKKDNLSVEFLDKLVMYMAIGTILGARLGHVFFYDPQYYLAHPLKIFKIWEGGLASHGAAIGILIAMYLFVRKFKVNFLWLMDRVVICVALAGMFIRLGNLMNSEIYGIQTSLPWGFIFVREGETVAKHPTQIYEALSYLTIFIILFTCYKKDIFIKEKGRIFGLFLIILFGARFMIEYIKNPQSSFEVGLPLYMGQILSIPFILLGVYLFFFKKHSTQTAK